MIKKARIGYGPCSFEAEAGRFSLLLSLYPQGLTERGNWAIETTEDDPLLETTLRLMHSWHMKMPGPNQKPGEDDDAGVRGRIVFDQEDYDSAEWFTFQPARSIGGALDDCDDLREETQLPTGCEMEGAERFAWTPGVEIGYADWHHASFLATPDAGRRLKQLPWSAASGLAVDQTLILDTIVATVTVTGQMPPAATRFHKEARLPCDAPNWGLTFAAMWDTGKGLPLSYRKNDLLSLPRGLMVAKTWEHISPGGNCAGNPYLVCHRAFYDWAHENGYGEAFFWIPVEVLEADQTSGLAMQPLENLLAELRTEAPEASAAKLAILLDRLPRHPVPHATVEAFLKAAGEERARLARTSTTEDVVLNEILAVLRPLTF